MTQTSFITSVNGNRRFMQLIRTTSRSPTRIRKTNQFSQFKSKSFKLAPIKKTWKRSKRSSFTVGLTTLHTISCIQHIQLAISSTSADMETIFHARSDGRYKVYPQKRQFQQQKGIEVVVLATEAISAPQSKIEEGDNPNI